MLKRTIVVALVFSLFAQAPLVFAQQRAAADWAAVKSVATGAKLVVKLKDGKTVKGELDAVTEQDVTLAQKNKPVTHSRDRIAQVYQVVGKAAKGKYALIGAGIGAAAGAGIGAIKYSPRSDDSEIYIGLGLYFGAGIGALVGMGWGASKRKEVLIYQAN